MKILKFGGTSLGDADRIRQAAGIVRQAAANGPVAVVVSAMAGVTNDLLTMAAGARGVASPSAAAPSGGAYRDVLKALSRRHVQTAEELLEHGREQLTLTLTAELETLGAMLEATYLLGEASPSTTDRILTYGERLCALVFAATLSSAGRPARCVDARRLIVTDDAFGHARVDFEASRERIRDALGTPAEAGSQPEIAGGKPEIAVVTGFTGATPDGRTTTLGRGGSDYTAALLGAALDAEAIEIWTDVDGVMSADPRIVADAVPLPALSYAELMELSHFGAKVVFPPTVHPAKSRGIPLVIKNTLRPEAEGTWIRDSAPPAEHLIRGLSSIHRVCLMRLEGDGMVGVPGIAGRLFGALARAGVSVILISQASSEHSICFAVAPEDAAAARDAVGAEFELERRLEMIDELIVDDGCSVIAAVGEQMCDRPGIAGRLFGVLGRHGINVRAVAQGSSELNVSLVVEAGDVYAALAAVHGAFFHPRRRRVRLALAGPGQVGQTLIEQLARQAGVLAEREGLELSLVAVADSRRLALEPGGIDLSGWRDALDAAPALDVERLIEHLGSASGEARVFIDCTASRQVTGWYPRLLERGVAVVAANKLAFAGEMSVYRELERARQAGGAPLMLEATVGAGLPVLRTLAELGRTGHEIERVDGVLSGTVNAVLGRLAAGETFSEAVRAAHAGGLTEPNPYEDLCGGDVARKLVILSRQAGHDLEIGDVEVEPLLPPDPWSGMDLDAFWRALPEVDERFDHLRRKAAEDGARLRYVASLGAFGARVALEAVTPDHPAFDLAGPDNLVAFITQHYRDTPLVVRGPGAGPAVTASGVFADVLAAVDALRSTP